MLAVLLALSLTADDPGRDLFNGRDLTGWVIDGPKEIKDKDGTVRPNWQVKDGHIVAGGAFGFLRYDQTFHDFTFAFEYRLEKGGNSGLGIRTGVFDPKKSSATRPSYFAYEVQLLDDADKPADVHSSGSLYRYVAPKSNAVKASPAWNSVAVTCVGPQIKVVLNGTIVQDVDQTTIPAIEDKPLAGFVCLQSHSKKAEFRRVTICEIKP